MNATPWFAIAVLGTFACSLNDEPAPAGAAGLRAKPDKPRRQAKTAAAAARARRQSAVPARAARARRVAALASRAAAVGGASAGSGGASGGSGGAAGAGGSASKPVCPEGPFPKPQAGQATTVCQGFQYAHDYNEGPTWVASQGAFFFSNFVQGAAGGNVTGDIIKYTPGGNLRSLHQRRGAPTACRIDEGQLARRHAQDALDQRVRRHHEAGDGLVRDVHGQTVGFAQ